MPRQAYPGDNTSFLKLRQKITAIVKKEKYVFGANAGVFVRLIKNDKIIYAKNATAPLVPSSNMKIITSAAALVKLGPDYRFETSIYGSEFNQAAGIIEGNLVLKGTGDPTFMKPFMQDATSVLYKFAAELHKKGIREIRGDLIADDSAFDREFIGRGWKYSYLFDEYAPPCSALSINGNVLELTLEPNKTTAFPPAGHIKIINRSLPSSRYGVLKITRRWGTDEITISGSIRWGSSIHTSITINNPALLTLSAFNHILLKKGIKIDGKVRLIEEADYIDYRRLNKICSHYSPPLSEILAYMNKESDNFTAEQVLKALAMHVKGKGTFDNAYQTICGFLKEAGIDSNGFVLADGCGLSMQNKVTCLMLVDVLEYMYNHPHKNIFLSTLPAAGVEGTMEGRLTGLPVLAKTGTLSGCTALSGYAVTSYGQTVAFSIIITNSRYSQWHMKTLEDKIVKAITCFNEEL